MQAVIFNGSMETGAHSVGNVITEYIKSDLKARKIKTEIFEAGKSEIPLLHPEKMRNVPDEVKKMCDLMQNADVHFWLSPLYHGSIPGIMKNCLDWMEITSKSSPPYLSDKIISMVCWADGSHALNGIQTMTTIAHSLRAWTLPYNVAVSTPFLYESNSRDEISTYYKQKINRLIELAVSRKIEMR